MILNGESVSGVGEPEQSLAREWREGLLLSFSSSSVYRSSRLDLARQWLDS